MSTTSYNSHDLVLTDAAQPAIVASSVNQIVVTKASVVNTDTTDHTITVHRVPSSGTPDATNMIIDAYPVAPGATVVLPLGGQVVTAGASFQVLSDNIASLTNFNISYITITG